ncbi:dual oxidase 1 [Sarcoptes scabiei]|nr:dual oxidase 1 [Sarcoptes scabiei]
MDFMIHSLTLFLIFSSLITRSFGTKVIMDRALQSNKTDVLNRDSGNDNFNYFVDNEDHIKRNEQTHFISPIRTNLAKQIGYSSMMNFLLYMLTFVPLLFSLVRNFQPSPYGGFYYQTRRLKRSAINGSLENEEWNSLSRSGELLKRLILTPSLKKLVSI